MKENIYLGNGCLKMTVENNNLSFLNWSVVTSQEVGCCKYEIVSNPKELKVIQSEDITKPNTGGGNITENELSVTMTANSSIVVLCNSQNQIDSYIKVHFDINGEVTFKVMAEQCYYSNEFQGMVGDVHCSEEEFKEFLCSFESQTIKKVNSWMFSMTSFLLGSFTSIDHKLPSNTMEFMVAYYGHKHGSYLKINQWGFIEKGSENDVISEKEILEWIDFATPYCTGEKKMPWVEKIGYYIPFCPIPEDKNKLNDLIWGNGYSAFVKNAAEIIIKGGEIPIPPNSEWSESSYYNHGLASLKRRVELMGR